MITVSMAILFIIIIFALFWYVFRGLKEDDINPIWGTLLATGVCAVLCAMLAYSFLVGNIADVSVVQNATYRIAFSPEMGAAQIANITDNLTSYQYVLGPAGTGMYTVAAVQSDTNLVPYIQNFTVTRYTSNIMYVQYQDMFLFFFFTALGICSAALFGYFMWKEVLSGFFGTMESEENSGRPDDGGE
jgi:hypothetical protein